MDDASRTNAPADAGSDQPPAEGAQARLERLRTKVSKSPTGPGVYLHKDAGGKILYVGKAKNLQARLRTYFTSIDQHPPKTKALVSKVHDFDVIVVQHENESLLLENNLIKHHMPPLNVLLRDDKTYPYLRLDLREDWPRLVKTRRRKEDGALYFGPYPNGGQLAQLLGVVNRYFPLVKCPPTVFRTVTRPCNFYHIKRCLGPCKLAVDKALYKDLVDNVVSILQGRTRKVTERLDAEMRAAAEALDFEKAARLRDQVNALQGLSETQGVTIDPRVQADVATFHWDGTSFAAHVATVRDGKWIAGESFILRRGVEEPAEGEGNDGAAVDPETRARAEAALSFLGQFYQRRLAPPALLLPEPGVFLGEAQRAAFQDYLRAVAKQQELPHADGIQLHLSADLLQRNIAKRGAAANLKEELSSIVKMAQDNARNRFQEHLQLDEDAQARLLGLQKLLDLPALPKWIECYDISTFQGAQTVASQVVFKDGRASKADYRKYIIRDVSGKADDFASLREVMRRRFKPEARASLPDLVIVDGGEPQVREVGYTLLSLGLGQQALAGIAKSRTKRDFRAQEVAQSEERLVVPQRNEDGSLDPASPPFTKPLRRGSPEFRLMTQLRDEAHRFAITFHRQRRGKASVKSVLGEIPGLGPKRRQQITKAFANLKELAALDVESIASRAGISSKLAASVSEAFQREFGGSFAPAPEKRAPERPESERPLPEKPESDL